MRPACNNCGDYTFCDRHSDEHKALVDALRGDRVTLSLKYVENLHTRKDLTTIFCFVLTAAVIGLLI